MTAPSPPRTVQGGRVTAPPVIFLDIDGVLLAGRHWRAGWKRPSAIPADTIALLNIAWLETEAAVCVSSTWRMDSNCRRQLRRAGFEGSFHRDWRTKEIRSDDMRRGVEIAEWLSRHPGVTSYVIIDDDSDMLPEQLPRFVQTEFEAGLGAVHVNKIVSILKAGQSP